MNLGPPLQVLNDWFAPYLSSGQLQILLNTQPISAEVHGDKIQAVHVSPMQGVIPGKVTLLMRPRMGYFLIFQQTEYVMGAEPDTGELHASTRPGSHNMQAPTWCFAMDYRPDEDHTIERPESYEYCAGLCPSRWTSMAWKALQFDVQPPHYPRAKDCII